MQKILIVGAGISGLATAFHLQQLVPTTEISVLEANSRPGGAVWTERRDGFQIELGANGFLDNRPSTIELCERLRLAGELLPAGEAAKHRYLFLNDRLERLPEGLWSFLRTPLLGWRSKLALLTERYRPARLDESDESVFDFISRRASAEVADVFGDALVTGIHAGDPRLLSMKAAFPRIVEMERKHGSVTVGLRHAARQRRRDTRTKGPPQRRGSRLLSFRHGMRRLIEGLVERLRRPPVFGVKVRQVAHEPDRHHVWAAYGEGKDRWEADAVILASPAHQQQEMLAELDGQLAGSIGEIAYSPTVVIALGYRRDDVPGELNGFGYIAPQRTRRDLLGVQWCSSIFPDRAPPGFVLLRGIAGGWHRRDLIAWDDERLLRAARAELRLSMRIDAGPVFQQIVRWEKAIPQYHLGHLERVSRIEAVAAKHAGLFLTGNAYRGVAVNDCTEQAIRVAAAVAGFLAKGHRP